MSHSFVKNTIHLVFSTKDRRPWLKESLRPNLYAYLAGDFQQWDSPAIVIGGHDDHVHSLFLLNQNHPLKKVVEEVKKGSSKWVKAWKEGLSGFSWQNSYSAFSVSESNLLEVKRYIERQAEHHNRMTLQEEFQCLLARHGMTIERHQT